MYSEPSTSSLSGPASMPTYPHLTSPVCTRYEVTVTDPERKGDGIQQYVCYKVSSLLEYTEGSGSPTTQSCVIRRFSDWLWLHDSLETELKSLLIPALPNKGMMNRFDPEFVEERRRALQLFLVRLMDHTILRQHANVLLFLTGTEGALNAARAKSDVGLKKATTKSIMSFFTSSMQLVTSTLAPGKEHPKTEDDIACDKIQEYAVNLQNELSLLESQVEGWLGRERLLGRAWSDLGMSVSMVAQAEGQGRANSVEASDRPTMGSGDSASSVDYVPPPIASPSSSSSYTSFSDASLGLGGDPELSRLLSLLGQSSDQLSMLLQRKETEETLEFREPLKDAQRTASAVEAMLKRRSTCLGEYHAALDQVESARSKLINAQGTPGREGKIPALEAAVGIAENNADAKKLELAQMSVAVRSEFQRSQSEKSAALSSIVRRFLALQLASSERTTAVWQNVLAQVNPAS